jgi:hypothetical protein
MTISNKFASDTRVFRRPASGRDPSSEMPTVYFTVFAGRRRFLGVLMAYVRPLLMRRDIDAVHLWDYCRLAADREYLRVQADAALGVEIIVPPASDSGAKFPNKWKGYYAHYAALLRSDDLLIKCDDDIVFLANLPALLRVARADRGAHLLYFPSIVNNDVAASFQAADGLITDPEYVLGLHASAEEGRYSRRPISDWFNCTKCAEHVHGLFLEQPSRFFTGCVHEWRTPARVPINLFVMSGVHVRTHFGAYANVQYVDEPYLTALLTERTQLPSLIVSDSVAVHFSFGFQHMTAERELLERYRRLAKDAPLHSKLAAQFGARNLSRACSAAPPAHLLLGRRNLPDATEQPTLRNSVEGGGRRGRGAGRGSGAKGAGRGAAAALGRRQPAMPPPPSTAGTLSPAATLPLASTDTDVGGGSHGEGWAHGGCRSLHIAINSAVGYEAPREKLLASMRAARVPMDQVHVFVAGDPAAAGRGMAAAGSPPSSPALPSATGQPELNAEASLGAVTRDIHGTRTYRVGHNSIDFSGLIHITENAHLFRGVTTWFYMHDTFFVSGGGFWPNISQWCNVGVPGGCALPLTRWGPSASTGLYDARFLVTQSSLLSGQLKNSRAKPPAVWKRLGVNWEDKLFKNCDATAEPGMRPKRWTRRCYNATLQRHTCICSSMVTATQPVQVYGLGSAPRVAYGFPCADLIKYKANNQREETQTEPVLRP